MNRMIFANLIHRPFRTIISVVAVAVEVTLILVDSRHHAGDSEGCQ